MRKKGIYEKFLKRPFDFILSIAAFIVLLPVFLFVSILVRINLGSPIVFKQDRPGLNEKIFRLYKFRTMTNKIDEKGELLPDSERLNKFGKFLRSTSLDELPSLVNIIKGDMSIVGPRPLLVKYLQRYDENQKKRHFVRPGLTGLSQVKGRNLLSWQDKFKFDDEYVNHITFSSDIKIILVTFIHIFKKTGITSETSETNEEFFGDEDKIHA